MSDKSNLKILFISRAYSNHSGGMERLSFELINSFQKLPNTEVTTIIHSGSKKTAPFFIFTSLFKALQEAPKNDVIHLGDPLLSFTGWVIQKITKKPVVVMVHGLDVTYPNKLYQIYLSLFFQRFNLYLSISKYTDSLLEKWKISGKRAVITPGISDNFFDPTIQKEELSKLLNEDTEDKKILFTVGRLVKRKGHAWFIANILPHLPHNVLYVITGKGPELDNIKKTIERYKMDSRVNILGRVKAKELKILYNTVDAFIQPNIKVSNDVEGFGLVLLEAALCNIPVFASKLEGMTDAITDQQNGFLLKSEDSTIWRKALNDFLNNDIAKNSPRSFTLEKFSWSKKVQEYLNIITLNI